MAAFRLYATFDFVESYTDICLNLAAPILAPMEKGSHQWSHEFPLLGTRSCCFSLVPRRGHHKMIRCMCQNELWVQTRGCDIYSLRQRTMNMQIWIYTTQSSQISPVSASLVEPPWTVLVRCWWIALEVRAIVISCFPCAHLKLFKSVAILEWNRCRICVTMCNTCVFLKNTA